eukprot:TRINITY_DN5599_c0_g3_i2.p1 TRINITY_DN5599_c0_g3~~TRINITY_DN5599_c0_g3_i2.p1  ORF type:complete len:203 (+),score=11.49 TRINITY_DN5599_c0_g3_i2:311-919(+)
MSSFMNHMVLQQSWNSPFIQGMHLPQLQDLIERSLSDECMEYEGPVFLINEEKHIDFDDFLKRKDDLPSNDGNKEFTSTLKTKMPRSSASRMMEKQLRKIMMQALEAKSIMEITMSEMVRSNSRVLYRNSKRVDLRIRHLKGPKRKIESTHMRNYPTTNGRIQHQIYSRMQNCKNKPMDSQKNARITTENPKQPLWKSIIPR